MQFGFEQNFLATESVSSSLSRSVALDDFVEALAIHVGKLRRSAAADVTEAGGVLPYVVSCLDPSLEDPILDRIEERRFCQRQHLVPLPRLLDYLPAGGQAYCDVFVLLVHPEQAIAVDASLIQLLALVVPRGGYFVLVGLGEQNGQNHKLKEFESILAKPEGQSEFGFEQLAGCRFPTFHRGRRSAQHYRHRSVFRQPRVAILNDHLKTFGGGERSTLQFARAFEELGFGVDVIAAHTTGITLEKLSDVFNIHPLKGWRQREFASNEELSQVLASEGYEIFLNHSFGSMLPSPIPLGFYMVMFPHWISPSEWSSIGTYRRVLANSAFTAVHIRERWNSALTPTVMIPPPHPISERVRLADKLPMILNVGRFNVRGHNKHQLEAIKSFCELQQVGIIPGNWKFVVVGNVNDSPDNRDYVAQCRAAALRGNVEILENASFEQLEQLYEQASLLWQFTGCDLDWGRSPEQCEHLGLVALDCFAYGVIPIIYQRSGMSYLLRHGMDGFVFENESDLRHVMSLVVGSFKTAAHQKMFDRCRALTKAFDAEVFRDNLERVIVSASNEVRHGASVGW